MTTLLGRFCLHQFFHWFAVGIILPVQILFLMSKGADLFQVGFCLSVYSAMVFLFELPTGGLADQIGRKTVYFISSAIAITGTLVFLLLSDNVVFLFIAFGFKGVARSLSTGTIDAWFVDRFKDQSPDGDLQKAFAVVGIWLPLGLGAGTLIGGVLPFASVAVHWEQYSLNLVIMLIAELWVVFYTIIRIDEPGHEFDKRLWKSFQNLPLVLSDALKFGIQHTRILLLMLATLCWGLSISGIEGFWQPQVKWILGSEEQSWIFGLLSAGYFIASAAGSAIITPVCRLFGNRYILVLVLFRVTMGISFVVLSIQTGIWGFAFLYLFMFFQNGMLNSPHQSLFHDLIPNEKRSTLVSLESLFLSIGGITGSLSLGWIANTKSIPFAWTIAGVVFSASSVFYLVFAGMNKKRKKGI